MSRLGQLAPEPRVLDELGRGGVVGVGVFPVGGEHQPGPHLAEDGGQGTAMGQGRLQAAVGQAEVLPPGVAQDALAAAVSAARRSGDPSGVGSPLVRSRMPTFHPR